MQRCESFDLVALVLGSGLVLVLSGVVLGRGGGSARGARSVCGRVLGVLRSGRCGSWLGLRVGGVGGQVQRVGWSRRALRAAAAVPRETSASASSSETVGRAPWRAACRTAAARARSRGGGSARPSGAGVQPGRREHRPTGSASASSGGALDSGGVGRVIGGRVGERVVQAGLYGGVEQPTGVERLRAERHRHRLAAVGHRAGGDDTAVGGGRTAAGRPGAAAVPASAAVASVGGEEVEQVRDDRGGDRGPGADAEPQARARRRGWRRRRGRRPGRARTARRRARRPTRRSGPPPPCRRAVAA